jgi:hypothetical protein
MDKVTALHPVKYQNHAKYYEIYSIYYMCTEISSPIIFPAILLY